MLKDLLTAKKKAIVQRWRDAIIATYPEDAAKFLKRDRDRFGNPIGYTISQETETLYTGLLARLDPQDLAESIDRMVRIRAVQDFSAAQAVGFVYSLKEAIRMELEADLGDEMLRELLEFELAIDSLALLTFDTYMKCREQLFDIRAGELKRWSKRPDPAGLDKNEDKTR